MCRSTMMIWALVMGSLCFVFSVWFGFAATAKPDRMIRFVLFLFCFCFVFVLFLFCFVFVLVCLFCFFVLAHVVLCLVHRAHEMKDRDSDELPPVFSSHTGDLVVFQNNTKIY